MKKIIRCIWKHRIYLLKLTLLFDGINDGIIGSVLYFIHLKS